jgi:hypothetical protein
VRQVLTITLSQEPSVCDALSTGISPIQFGSRWLEHYDAIQLIVLTYIALTAPYQASTRRLALSFVSK